MSNLQGMPRIPAGSLTDVDTTKKYRLGTKMRDEKGNLYIYLEGVASTAAGDWVVYYDDDYTTARMTKAEVDKLYPVAVAMAATVANKYGWYLIQGTGEARVLASCAEEVPLYTSATAGSADDDSTSQTKINRTVSHDTDSGSGGLVTVHIDFPSAA